MTSTSNSAQSLHDKLHSLGLDSIMRHYINYVYMTMIFTAIQLENLLLFFLSVHQTLEKFKQGSIRF